ncbi:MAG: YqzL family protein [Intestinibacter sp.]|uniref:YqzL family protein n=1 Tax=Intestinibacter sp. TaxID=1965304 RepID=UPI003F14FA27
MYKLFWEVFKRTGSIEAYLYLYDYRVLSEERLEKRETLNNNGDCKYPRNSP